MIVLKVRVIPLLLLKGSSLVKSVKFKDHRVVGDAISTIKVFSQRFADEMVILDLDAAERGAVNSELLARVSTICNMPLCFGGGIDTLEKADLMFKSGADKIVLNSVYFTNPPVVNEIVRKYGRQSIVLSLDVKYENGEYNVYYHNGTSKWLNGDIFDCLNRTSISEFGEVFINDITRDGMMNGFDLSLIKEVRKKISTPLVIAGGCGSKEDFKFAFDLGADAVCAGSVFHWVGESIIGIKNYLNDNNINVRTI